MVNAVLNVTTMGMGSTVAKLRHLKQVAAVAGKATQHADETVEAWKSLFPGAGLQILNGVERLARLAENEWVPPWLRKGAEAQLRRAEEYFKAGRLQAVELVEGANRYDLVLVTGEVVEIKYRRQSDAASDKAIADLAGQLRNYQAGGRDVKLEFVRTKTDPITEEFLDSLRTELASRGVDISRLTIELVDY